MEYGFMNLGDLIICWIILPVLSNPYTGRGNGYFSYITAELGYAINE